MSYVGLVVRAFLAVFGETTRRIVSEAPVVQAPFAVLSSWRGDCGGGLVCLGVERLSG